MIPDFTLDFFLQMVENTKLTSDSDGYMIYIYLHEIDW